ncbi:MAG: hypothetical protein JSS65_00530 [Armatimonadetes bacterium]|nr:hypothetical protein [Armatimonadota bacterium]
MKVANFNDCLSDERNRMTGFGILLRPTAPDDSHTSLADGHTRPSPNE